MEALVDFLKHTSAIPTNIPKELKFSEEQFEVEKTFKAYLRKKKIDSVGREDTQALIQKDLLLDD